MPDLALPIPGDHTTLSHLVAHFEILEPIFDAMQDVVFFVKDTDARYVLANATLAARCGFKDKRALLGKQAEQVFPPRFGHIYTEQDKAVLKLGSKLIDQLELHLYPGRRSGWCLTSKLPMYDAKGRVLGVVGISRDLQVAEDSHPAYTRLAIAAKYIQDNYAEPLRLPDIAKLIDLSVAQIERYFHKIFHLTPRQMLLKTRLDAASALLAGDLSITDIATRCGYNDHSAFTRQFKATVGLTPSQYRGLLHPKGTADSAT
ncbi:AraC family transcriptional regulator [Paraburkholderia sediminicola]|uniref:helix-turn-helix domain-containing protein n=1 Tax=Paraburkholderia sediminicola TaxID=458836 RepID=UPI0038BCCADD